MKSRDMYFLLGIICDQSYHSLKVKVKALNKGFDSSVDFSASKNGIHMLLPLNKLSN